MSSETTEFHSNPALERRPMDPVTSILDRLERKIDKHGDKLDKQVEAISDIKARMASGDERMRQSEGHGDRLSDLETALTEIRTKLNVIWAGVAVAGTTAIGAAATAIISAIG